MVYQMKLYEIEDAIMDVFDPETGEILDEDKLARLEMERDKKIENIALYIKDLKAEAEAIKTEKMNLTKRQQTAENHAESLKRYLTKCLDGEKFKTARVAISYRKSETVEFIDGFDINLLPDQYQRKRDPEADKTALKDALKEGKEIYGVYLAEHNNAIIK